MDINQLIQKLKHQPLTEEEHEQLFEEIVLSLSAKINLNLGYDVQENLSVGYSRCIAYEHTPGIGDVLIQVMVFISVQTDEEHPVIADILFFSQGIRLCRNGARTGEFFRFTASQAEPTHWSSEGWQGDEYGEYERYDKLKG